MNDKCAGLRRTVSVLWERTALQCVVCWFQHSRAVQTVIVGPVRRPCKHWKPSYKRITLSLLQSWIEGVCKAREMIDGIMMTHQKRDGKAMYDETCGGRMTWGQGWVGWGVPKSLSPCSKQLLGWPCIHYREAGVAQRYRVFWRSGLCPNTVACPLSWC